MLERGSSPRARGVVRLTEYEGNRKNGFLDRFARRSLTSSTETAKHTSQEVAKSPGPFKHALLNGRVEKDSSVVASLEVEVVPEVMNSLEGSFVGRLGEGVEVRALQTKLWLSGLLSITVVVMGGDLVLISNSSGDEVRGPITNKGWWGGLLFDIKRWTPNMVYSKREIWVEMFGVPLHAWGETTFRSLANRCGRFLAVDTPTSNRTRLDVARVKLEAPLSGLIDFTFKLLVQGAGYCVRVVEERGCVVVEREEIEDQLHPDDAVSSCASGGIAAAMVAVEVLGDDDTDSEASETCQRQVSAGRQEVKKSTGAKGNEGIGVVMTGESSGIARLIPSTDQVVKVTAEKGLATSSQHVRGSPLLGEVEKEGQQMGDHQVVTPNLSGTRLLTEQVDGHVAIKEGYVGQKGKDSYYEELGRIEGIDPGSAVGPAQDVESGFANFAGGRVVPDPVINELVDNISHSRANLEGGGFCVEDSDSISTCSPSINESQSPVVGSTQSVLRKINKHRKPSTPLSSLLGPKCMRFADVVNNNRRRNQANKSSAHQDAILWDDGPVEKGDANEEPINSLSASTDTSEEEPVLNASSAGVSSESSQGLNLEVVLPFHPENRAQSGVNLLLNEDSIHDVNGFTLARDNPEAIALEAQKLLIEQKKVGFTFDPQEEAPIGRMVTMEVRDRAEFMKSQEVTRPQ
ncbi:hypothetical protein P8452_72524 [Trifolium repens]|nr:hypothetical protein P8452_72524 [Trifolium repens]